MKVATKDTLSAFWDKVKTKVEDVDSGVMDVTVTPNYSEGGKIADIKVSDSDTSVTTSLYVQYAGSNKEGIVQGIDSSVTEGSNNPVCGDAVYKALDALTSISYQVVGSLPSTGENGVIYLVSNNSSENQNIYDEYIYVNNAFEKIGTTEVDLSDYAKTTDLSGSATIATKSSDVVTLKAGITESNGVISNSSSSDITLAKVASTGSASDVSLSSSNVSATDVKSAVDELYTDYNSVASDLKTEISERKSADEALEAKITELTENGVTYSLSKSGSTITLTGTDGSTSTVEDSDTTYTAGTNIQINGTTISATDTTYNVATSSANGLMSSTDKTKLDKLEELEEITSDEINEICV